MQKTHEVATPSAQQTVVCEPSGAAALHAPSSQLSPQHPARLGIFVRSEANIDQRNEKSCFHTDKKIGTSHTHFHFF